MQRHDIIIVGAGPAGMAAAVYASRAAWDVLMLEQQMPGGKLLLTSEVENYPGTGLLSGPDLADEMYRHATMFGAVHAWGDVRRIERNPTGGTNSLLVHCTDRVLEAGAVIIASGTRERKLGIPGEEEYYGMGVSYCAVCDGAFFRDRETLVIGGGSTAFEDALYLTRFASKVTVAMRRDVSRAEVLTQQRVRDNPRIDVRHWWVPLEILGDNGRVSAVRFKNVKTDEVFVHETAVVFPLIGVLPNTGFVAPEILNEERYIVTDERMRTSVPGLFAAGDVRAKRLRQIVTATGDGAIAAEEAGHYLDTLN